MANVSKVHNALQLVDDADALLIATVVSELHGMLDDELKEADPQELRRGSALLCATILRALKDKLPDDPRATPVVRLTEAMATLEREIRDRYGLASRQ